MTFCWMGKQVADCSSPKFCWFFFFLSWLVQGGQQEEDALEEKRLITFLIKHPFLIRIDREDFRTKIKEISKNFESRTTEQEWRRRACNVLLEFVG